MTGARWLAQLRLSSTLENEMLRFMVNGLWADMGNQFGMSFVARWCRTSISHSHFWGKDENVVADNFGTFMMGDEL